MGFPLVRQQDQTDCAAASLATVAAHHGCRVGLARARELVGVDLDGASLLGLIKGGEALGFSAKGVKGDWDGLRHIPLPAVVHCRDEENRGHFVVLVRLWKDRALLGDPARGMEKVGREEFCRRWSGYAVVLTPKSLRLDEPSSSKGELLRALMAPHWGTLAGALLCALVLTGLGLGSSLFMRHLVDHILVHGRTSLLDLAGVALAMVLLFRAVFSTVRGWFLVDLARKVDLALISLYVRHLMRLPMRFFETRQVGEVLSRVGDAAKIRGAISGTVLGAVVDGTMVVGAAAAMVAMDAPLAFMVLLFVPVFVGILVAVRRPLARAQRRVMELSAEVDARFVEDVSSVETVKAFGAEPLRSQESDTKLVRLTRGLFSTDRIGLVLDALLLVVAGAGLLVSLWWGGHRVVEGRMTVGTLLAFHTLAGCLFTPLESLASVGIALQEAAIALDRLWEVLVVEPEGARVSRPPKVKRLRDGVLFDKVSFRYGHRGPVLREVDLFLPAGKTVALVGESGCGKSTVCKLLARFHEPTEGRILADGLDLRDLPIEAWRRKVGYVGQDPAIFNGTIAENIAFGRPQATQEHIVRAAELAGLDEFIEGLPDRYATRVGERGMNLSGGQRQRLSIARAILCDPEIYVLDEATSHLDTRTEKAIQSTLREVLRGRTTLIVAHRLSTVKNADLIYVVSEGTVAEWGTHEQLIRETGLYWMLWAAQVDMAVEAMSEGVEPAGPTAPRGEEPIVLLTGSEASRVRKIPGDGPRPRALGRRLAPQAVADEALAVQVHGNGAGHAIRRR